MSISAEQIQSVQRPVHTLWGKLIIEPFAVPLGRTVANHTKISPLALTLASFALALVSAAAFLQATPLALIVGAVIYQLSTLADILDGMIARAKPGSGSLWALVLDHSLDPWRLILNVAAIAYGQYLVSGNSTLFVFASLFLAIHFSDWIEPRLIHKLRYAYKSIYEPTLTRFDERVLSLKNRVEPSGWRLIFFNVHERELVVLFVGPILGFVEGAFAVCCVLALLFYLARLRLDVALLRNELVNQVSEYLGDEEHKWEAGAKSLSGDELDAADQPDKSRDQQK